MLREVEKETFLERQTESKKDQRKKKVRKKASFKCRQAERK